MSESEPQPLPLRVQSLPKQPVSIDLLDRAFDRRAALVRYTPESTRYAVANSW